MDSNQQSSSGMALMHQQQFPPQLQQNPQVPGQYSDSRLNPQMHQQGLPGAPPQMLGHMQGQHYFQQAPQAPNAMEQQQQQQQQQPQQQQQQQNQVVEPPPSNLQQAPIMDNSGQSAKAESTKEEEKENSSESGGTTAAAAAAAASSTASAVVKKQNHHQPKILFSGFVISEMDSLMSDAKELGAEIVHSAHAQNATHLVMPKLGRTISLLCAINYVKFVLYPDWISESKKENKFLGSSTLR